MANRNLLNTVHPQNGMTIIIPPLRPLSNLPPISGSDPQALTQSLQLEQQRTQKLQDEIDSLRKSNADIQGQLRPSQDALLIETQRATDLQRQLQDTQQQLISGRQDVINAVVESTVLKGQLKTSQQELKTANQSIANLAILKKALSDSVDERKILQQEIDKLKEAATKTQAVSIQEQEDLKTEIRQLKRQAADSKTLRDAEKGDLQNEIQILKKQAVDTMALNDSEKQDLRNEIQTLQQQQPADPSSTAVSLREQREWMQRSIEFFGNTQIVESGQTLVLRRGKETDTTSLLTVNIDGTDFHAAILTDELVSEWEKIMNLWAKAMSYLSKYDAIFADQQRNKRQMTKFIRIYGEEYMNEQVEENEQVMASLAQEYGRLIRQMEPSQYIVHSAMGLSLERAGLIQLEDRAVWIQDRPRRVGEAADPNDYDAEPREWVRREEKSLEQRDEFGDEEEDEEEEEEDEEEYP